jgi:hypothetical protein
VRLESNLQRPRQQDSNVRMCDSCVLSNADAFSMCL